MSATKFTNTLWTRDNLEILHGLNSESVDLIYLDPPFNSKRLYSAPIGSKAAGAAFKDTWTWSDVDEACLETLVIDYPAIVRFIEATQLVDKGMAAYLTYMAQRLIEMKRVLKNTGSIYLHCDPTASHYLKVLLDAILGEKKFLNEIVWCYSHGGKSKSDFANKHDIILRYSKGSKYIFNGKDIAIPMTPHKQDKSGKNYGGKMGVDENGRQYVEKQGTRDKNGNYKYYRYYIDEGKIPEDWWTDINSIQSGAAERTGYPTQKPLVLLHRIIKASSNIGDIVLDPFCGCATACVAAQQLQRRWIGIDIEAQASKILIDRLSDDAGLFSDFVHRTDIPQRTDIKTEPMSKSVKDRLFSIQKGKCSGCGNAFDVLNLEIDHIIPKAKGGGDYFENYQLLCGSCNRIKGSRPMEYLRQKIKARDVVMKKVSFGE